MRPPTPTETGSVYQAYVLAIAEMRQAAEHFIRHPDDANASKRYADKVLAHQIAVREWADMQHRVRVAVDVAVAMPRLEVVNG